MLTTEMLADMCCPACPDQELHAQIWQQDGIHILEGELRCQATGETFPVHSGIPSLLPTGVLTDPAWRTWEDHLAGFQARRDWRVKNPDQTLTRWGEKSKPHSRFARFTGIGEGKVLDVGCGPGKLRAYFGNSVVYYGLDPIVLPEVDGFPFVQALSEYMPFKSQTFSHVVVSAALDHFKDLEAFFREALRVLTPNGQLHLVQSVHELRSPLAAAKMLGHWLKDTLEDRRTKTKNSAAPKHVTEFTTSSLHETMTKHFVVAALDQYSFRWYSPTKLLVTLTPRPAGMP
jgi:ubiquinone/menaquinone biosynthesis C-methylase UbiE/uncharacterized protein YbaR (Trm112 family)